MKQNKGTGSLCGRLVERMSSLNKSEGSLNVPALWSVAVCQKNNI